MIVRSQDRESGSSADGLIKMKRLIPEGEYQVERFVMVNKVPNLSQSASMRFFEGTDEIGGPFTTLSFDVGVWDGEAIESAINAHTAANLISATVSFNDAIQKFEWDVTSDMGFYIEGDGAAELKLMLGLPNTLYEQNADFTSAVCDFALVPYLLLFIEGTRVPVTSGPSAIMVLSDDADYNAVLRQSSERKIYFEENRYVDYHFERPDGSIAELGDEEWIMELKKV